MQHYLVYILETTTFSFENDNRKCLTTIITAIFDNILQPTLICICNRGNLRQFYQSFENFKIILNYNVNAEEAIACPSKFFLNLRIIFKLLTNHIKIL